MFSLGSRHSLGLWNVCNLCLCYIVNIRVCFQSCGPNKMDQMPRTCCERVRDCACFLTPNKLFTACDIRIKFNLLIERAHIYVCERARARTRLNDFRYFPHILYIAWTRWCQKLNIKCNFSRESRAECLWLHDYTPHCVLLLFVRSFTCSLHSTNIKILSKITTRIERRTSRPQLRASAQVGVSGTRHNAPFFLLVFHLSDAWLRNSLNWALNKSLKCIIFVVCLHTIGSFDAQTSHSLYIIFRAKRLHRVLGSIWRILPAQCATAASTVDRHWQ